MRKNPTLWPILFPKEKHLHRPADSRLSMEDHDTQIMVDRYLHLANDFLKESEPEPEEDAVDTTSDAA